MSAQVIGSGGRLSRALTDRVAETSSRACLHCGTAMRRVEEHALVFEQYTRQAWWRCTECGHTRCPRA